MTKLKLNQLTLKNLTAPMKPAKFFGTVTLTCPPPIFTEDVCPCTTC